MLELWEPDGALAALEGYLAAEEFWDRRGVVAEPDGGYGLSSVLRRTDVPVPREPCRLPLLACRIRPERVERAHGGRFVVGDWERTWEDEAYADAIEAVRAAIARGD